MARCVFACGSIIVNWSNKLGSFSLFAGLLGAGVFSACSGTDEWEEIETGELAEAFTNPATGVGGTENAGVPFVSTVKINVNGEGCTATKIPRLANSTRDRFLTAAHCLPESASNRTVTITNAINGSGATSFTIPGGRTFQHPSFQVGGNGDTTNSIDNNVYDVAFFEVNSGPTFSTVAPVFTPIAESGANLSAIGYGNAGSGCGAVGGTKLKISFTTTAGSGLARRSHYINFLGEPRNCPGDSGGPVLSGAGANARLVGVVSGSITAGTTPLNSYTRIANVLEWINDPVDSTLASIPAALITNNSTLYIMNGSLDATTSRARLNCAAMESTSPATALTSFDVRARPCDGPDALLTLKPPAWRLLNSASLGNSFKIVNRLNGSCMGINTTPAANVNVAAFLCENVAGAALDRQSWTFEAVSGAVSGTTAYRLRTRASTSFCLSSNGNDNDDVVLAACSTSNSQKWYLTR